MHIVTQFSVFLINKPGILSQVLEALAKSKVNILAMTMMDSVEHGVLRIVAAQPKHCREVLKTLSLQINETDVLSINLSNKPGAMADVATKLSASHINITYCYVTAGARGGRTTGVFKVSDNKKSIKILEKKTKSTTKKVKKKTAKRSTKRK